MARLFGTDGVRGLANAELTPELAMSVAAARSDSSVGSAGLSLSATIWVMP